MASRYDRAEFRVHEVPVEWVDKIYYRWTLVGVKNRVDTILAMSDPSRLFASRALCLAEIAEVKTYCHAPVLAWSSPGDADDG